MGNRTFTGQVAIITGAGQGIGFEIARQLAKQGASVLINDIEAGLAERSVKAIKAQGGQAAAFVGDASQMTCIEEMIARAVDHFGRLDIAVANAGITTFGSFLTYTTEQFQQLMAVNLQGSFFLAQQAARQIIKQGGEGRILFMSSVTGHQAHPNLSAYGMTKAALEMLAKALSVELAAHKITVNAIAPGATLTERTLEDPAYLATWERITPTARVSTTEDIAQAALFLLSPQARQITGQSLIVDGGWTSVSPPPDQ